MGKTKRKEKSSNQSLHLGRCEETIDWLLAIDAA
jgi:hypothetical protein